MTSKRMLHVAWLFLAIALVLGVLGMTRTGGLALIVGVQFTVGSMVTARIEFTAQVLARALLARPPAP